MDKLTITQKRSLVAMVDAAVPSCGHRRQFFEYAHQDLNVALDWLKTVEGVNQDTVAMIEQLVNPFPSDGGLNEPAA